MKKFISLILTISMLLTMIGTFSVSAATDDGALDFDLESAPTLTVTGEGTSNEMHTYTEDGYTIQGRVSHPAHNWGIEKDAFGKKGYSILGKGVKDVAVSETQSDPCMIGFVNLTNPKYLTSTDQYYTFEFDVAMTGANNFELLATTDDGSTVVLFNGNGENRTLVSDALRQTNGLYIVNSATWHNIKVVIKSADVTVKDGDANDTAAEDTHQFWIYGNGNLVKSGTTSIKKRNSTSNVNSFAGFKAFQFRAYGIHDSAKKTTGDWSIRLDNVSTSVSDSLPVTNWESELTFDAITETTDIDTINNELWAKETKYLISGKNATWVRNTTKGLASVEGGVFGKDASDKAISVSLDGNQTDGTHFFQVTQSGQGMNQMHRMSKGDFYEFQTYMAWEPDAKIIGVQGFYSNTASNDGKGSMLLDVSPSTGLIGVLGARASDTVKLSPNTWYKFNIIIHSGDVNAANDADKNWYTLYVNDTLVAQKKVFKPTIRNGTQPTFLGVDQYWFQVGVGSAKTSGKAYYDDIKIKYSTTEKTYSPVLVSTTDEVAASYLGTDGHVPGVGSYIDERVTFDADKWAVTDGEISFVPASNGNTYAKIVKADGTKIYDTFKNENVTVDAKTFAADSNVGSLLNYAAKDFTTHTLASGVAGRSADDYSLKMDSVGVYDNWVMVKDEDGNDTSAEYQKNPENWVNKSDIPSDTKATYKFRDSFNPFMQMFKGTHTGAIDFTAPWSMNISILAGGEFNSKDIQVISDDNGGRVTINLVSISGSNGHIVVNKVDTGALYKKDQWMNFVINVYPATKGLGIWYDGEQIFSGKLDFPWARLARIKLQDAIAHSGYHSAKARTSRFYADDIMFIQGSRFVPVAINAISTSDKFDSTYLEEDVIVANNDTTAEDILTGIAGGTVSLYGDKNYQAVTTGAVNKGNIAVIKSADGLMYKYIYVANADQDAKASMAFGQSYQIGINTFAPKYYTDNVVDGTIIAATYKTVNGNTMVENCDYEVLENETYEYDGNNLIMTPSKRVEIDATKDTNAVKIFIWDDISGLKPLAAEHNCAIKVAE